MKTLSLLLFTLLPLTGHAELNVIADLGGEDAAPYFEAVNKQPGMPGVAALSRRYCVLSTRA